MTKLQSVLTEVCELDGTPVAANAPFGEIKGWDSMRAVTFQVELERLFGVDLSDTMIPANWTLDELAGVLQQKGVTSERLS
ncbi:MAG TPA: acyl carrier protein [Bryobacteraceae bacterium]|jgi:acyl carrier protein|nr:acyl carrier protein [Bryobacteraceae bacterium]